MPVYFIGQIEIHDPVGHGFKTPWLTSAPGCDPPSALSGAFSCPKKIDKGLNFRLILLSLEYATEPFNREGDMD